MNIACLTIGVANFYLHYYYDALGLLALFAGIYLNHMVCHANGGSMPVFSADQELLDGARASKGHHIGTHSTQYKCLADIIPAPFFGAMSVGDIFIFAGYLYSAACVPRPLLHLFS